MRYHTREIFDNALRIHITGSGNGKNIQIQSLLRTSSFNFATNVYDLLCMGVNICQIML